MGIKGAAVATVIAQYVSGVGILLYFLVRYPEYHISRKDMKWNRENLKQIMSLSGFKNAQILFGFTKIFHEILYFFHCFFHQNPA